MIDFGGEGWGCLLYMKWESKRKKIVYRKVPSFGVWVRKTTNSAL